MLNPPIVLAIPQLTPAAPKTTQATYLEAQPFKKRSSEYQNYLIARDHKPSIVKKQFSEVKKKTRSEARQKQTKQDKVSHLKFITSYNPALPNIHNIIQNNLSILHTDENMKKIFPSKSIKTFYRREKTRRNFYHLPCFLPNLRIVRVV